MSRAFVKESDGPEPSVRVAPELPPGTPNHITPWGAAAIRERLAECQAEARELADRTDGVSLAQLTELRAEIRYLEGRIDTFVETAPPEDPVRAGFGTRVRLEGDDGERVIEIVGVDEVAPEAGRISWLSPLARALLGASEGDEVTVQTPRGELVYEVLSITRGG